MHCSPPSFSVHGILQARTLEWVAMPTSRGSPWPRDQIWVFCKQFLYCLSHQGSQDNNNNNKYFMPINSFILTMEKAMAPLSSTLAWQIPWTEEPGGCHLWGHTESDKTEQLSTNTSFKWSVCEFLFCYYFLVLRGYIKHWLESSQGAEWQDFKPTSATWPLGDLGWSLVLRCLPQLLHL